MYRNNIELVPNVECVNFVMNHGALGDMLTSLPAVIRARVTHSEHLKMKVWVGEWQRDLVEHLLAPYGKFEVIDIAKFPMKVSERKGWKHKEWTGGAVCINQAPYNTHTRNRVHMVDYSFRYLLDAQPEDMLQRSYPTAADIGGIAMPDMPYIVFPVGATSENKLFKAKVMVPIMEWAIENGYRPVIVGTKTSHTKVEAKGKFIPIKLIDEADKIPGRVLVDCIDLREKTTLLQLRSICGHARAVVGVDGGTIHLAGTTDTNIIYGLTTTLPQHRFIARQGDPMHKIRYVGPRDLECTGCQSNMTLMFGHDFRHCPYGDSICRDHLHADDFIAGLKELGL
jgi:ADP-heptose:LPS heptosyltransferase